MTVRRARERLEQIQLENEIKTFSFELREKELDTPGA